MSVEAAVLITGLTMVADRVASQRRYWVPNADTPSFGAAEHCSHAREQAEEEVERLRLTASLWTGSRSPPPTRDLRNPTLFRPP